jgi:hypothetical protein
MFARPPSGWLPQRISSAVHEAPAAQTFRQRANVLLRGAPFTDAPMTLRSSMRASLLACSVRASGEPAVRARHVACTRYISMQAPIIVPKQPVAATTAKRPTELRCRQCGEPVDSSSKLQQDTYRILCIDCAFDALPCTD